MVAFNTPDGLAPQEPFPNQAILDQLLRAHREQVAIKKIQTLITVRRRQLESRGYVRQAETIEQQVKSLGVKPTKTALVSILVEAEMQLKPGVGY